MEKLEMSREKDLRIYCFSLRSRFPFATIPVNDPARFYLGYSLDDVRDSVFKRFGGNIDIVMHGDISFKEMANKIDLANEVVDAPPLSPEMFHPGAVIQSPVSKEMNQVNFVNGLRLMADKYVDAEDRKILQDIIDKVNFKKE